MSQLRFQHVFGILMGLSLLSGFVLPRDLANKTQPQLQALFAPVARPAGALGAFISSHLGRDPVRDHRSTEAIRSENEELKATVANLSVMLDEQRRRNAERQKLGVLRDLCVVESVVGADSGPRESLSLSGSSLEGVREKMPVLFPGGVVGQVERAGLAGAQVRLLTDAGFRIRGKFAQFRRRPDNKIEFVELELPHVLVEGTGRGMMLVRTLTVAQASVLAEGNWVVASEPDWPPILNGQPLGRVTRIGRRREAPLYAEVRIEPETNLTRLREVMVLVKNKAEE